MRQVHAPAGDVVISANQTNGLPPCLDDSKGSGDFEMRGQLSGMFLALFRLTLFWAHGI